MNIKIQNSMDQLQQVEKLLQAGSLIKAKELAKSFNFEPALHNAVLASICTKEGDLQQAEVLFLKSLEQKPNNILALGNLSQLYTLQKKYKTALPYAEKAYEQQKVPNYALTYASCLSENDQCKKAIEVLTPFLDLKNPKLNILIALASLMRADLRPKEAFDLLNTYSNKFVNELEYQKTLAEVLSEISPQEGSLYFEKVSKLLPENIALKWNWSFVELRLRNFEKGWQLYESGLDDKIGKVGRPLPAQVKLVPRITELASIDKHKWTLFSMEQGIGDQILFSGCLNQVFKTYPKSIIVAEDRMVPILSRAFPNVGVYTYGFVNVLSNQLERVNGVFPVGSLQKFYRKNTAEYINNQDSFLLPNEKLVSKYSKIFCERLPGKKLIGISWRGGYWDRQIRTKSFEFQLFKEFMKNSNYHFISLQYGDIRAEKEMAAREGLPISFIDGIDFKKDLDAWISLGSLCDEIISVSTALVHFMGAMGKKVTVMISDHQAPFIWGLEDGPSLPYKNVSTYRKRKAESVDDFFIRMSKQYESLS